MALAELTARSPTPNRTDGDETMARRPTLEQMRRRRLLTATALAKLADIAVTTVRGIERGAVPRFDTIRRLSDALGCQPDEIAWPDNPLGLDENGEPQS